MLHGQAVRGDGMKGHLSVFAGLLLATGVGFAGAEEAADAAPAVEPAAEEAQPVAEEAQAMLLL